MSYLLQISTTLSPARSNWSAAGKVALSIRLSSCLLQLPEVNQRTCGGTPSLCTSSTKSLSFHHHNGKFSCAIEDLTVLRIAQPDVTLRHCLNRKLLSDPECNTRRQLRIEHRDLDDAIERLAMQPGVDELALRRMKKRKLQIKDSVRLLEMQLVPDIPA